MARTARIVLPNTPHHVTQRGNNRQRTFHSDDDYRAYLRIAATEFREAGVAVWSYCLMPNHVHLIAVPSTEEALGRAVGRTHLRYTKRLHAVHGCSGHIWQGRFASFPMDSGYLANCARYIALNPVRAGLVRRAIDWRWSSAAAQVFKRADRLISGDLEEHVGRLDLLFETDVNAATLEVFRSASVSGLPIGSPDWIAALEAARGRRLRPAR